MRLDYHLHLQSRILWLPMLYINVSSEDAANRSDGRLPTVDPHDLLVSHLSRDEKPNYRT